MTEKENGHISNQWILRGNSQNLTLGLNEEEENNLEDWAGVIDEINKKYVLNQWCKITLLPRLIINGQLFVPFETCERLVAFQQAIEQDEQGEDARRNYVSSPVLDDEIGEVESLDFNYKATPEGAYDFSSREDNAGNEEATDDERK